MLAGNQWYLTFSLFSCLASSKAKVFGRSYGPEYGVQGEFTPWKLPGVYEGDLEMEDKESELAIFCCQISLPFEGLEHKPIHITFHLQFILPG